MPELQFSFTHTQADLLELRKSAKLPAGGPRWHLLLFAILVLLLYGTPAFLDWLMPPPPMPPAPDIKQYLLTILPWVYVIGFLYIVLRSVNRQEFRSEWESSPLHRLLRTITISEDALIEETAAFTCRYRWSAFIDLSESPNLLLLFISTGKILIIPKRALPAGTDPSALRQWINDRINWFRLDPQTLAARIPDAALPTIFPRLYFTCNANDLARARRAALGLRLLIIFAVGCAVCVAGFAVLAAVIIWKIATSPGWAVTFSENESVQWWQLAILVIAFIAAQMFLRARAWRKAGHLHGPQAVDVTETGLRFTTSARTQWLAWQSIQRIRRTPNMTAFHLHDGTLWLIPTRAFPSPQAAQQFDAFLQNHLRPTRAFPIT